MGLIHVHVDNRGHQSLFESFPALVDDEIIIFNTHDFFFDYLPQIIFRHVTPGDEHFREPNITQVYGVATGRHQVDAINVPQALHCRHSDVHRGIGVGAKFSLSHAHIAWGKCSGHVKRRNTINGLEVEGFAEAAQPFLIQLLFVCVHIHSLQRVTAAWASVPQASAPAYSQAFLSIGPPPTIILTLDRNPASSKAFMVAFMESKAVVSRHDKPTTVAPVSLAASTNLSTGTSTPKSVTS